MFLHVDGAASAYFLAKSGAQLVHSSSNTFIGPAFSPVGSSRKLLCEYQDEFRPRTRAVSSAADYAAVSSRRRNSSSIWLDQSESEDVSGEDEEDGKVLYVDAGDETSNDKSNLEITKLGVAKDIVDGLAARGITSLFPIQRAVFEPAMKGVDLIARAKTGTGKTLAFGIPIMDRIYRDRNKMARRSARRPAALVLAPTRELAKQVEKEFMESGRDLATVCVYGGVSILGQKRALAAGVDIAVGTPGRIIDLMDQGSLNLSEVQYMVLDEADQMLAVGFEEDVERIMEQLPAKRQNMLFSATMPSWVQKLSRKFLRSPVTIDLVGDQEEKLAEGIKLFAVQSSRTGKRTILCDVITVYAKGGKAIVFTQTKRDAEEVSLAMNRTLGCEALHGDIAQFQREKTLGAFREGKFSILVATDVAARGLDIDNVDLVVHYDLPRDSETFVHRSGRTGRAGKEGNALVLYSMEDRRTLKQIERDVGCKFEYKGPPRVDEVLKSSSTQAVEVIKNVHPELKDVFLPTAEMLLEEFGPSAFAAAIAHMSGFSQPPASRSLITHETGWMTLTYIRSSLSMPIAVRQVVAMIGSISQKAADNMGKVHLIDDAKVEGAVFDLPEDLAKDLLSKPIPPGDTIEAIKELPKLQQTFDSLMGRSSYGRFDGGRPSFGRSSFGSGYGGRGGGSGYGGRGGDSGYGGRGGGTGYSRFSSGRSSAGRSSDDRYGGVGDGRRSSSYGGNNRGSSSYGGNDRNFGGTCYKCGKSGHRASDCFM